MSNTKLIETLCGVIEIFCELVRKLSSELEQVNALNEESRKAIQSAFDYYSEAIGADEAPDL